MRAEHVLGPLGHRGDCVDVEVGGVRGEDRAGLGDRVEPLEHALLELHVLEHRFDHEVGVGERIEVERGREPAHPLLDLGHASGGPSWRGRLVVAAHDRDAAVERLLRGLDDRDRNAGATGNSSRCRRPWCRRRSRRPWRSFGSARRRGCRRPSPPAARRKRRSAAPWTGWSASSAMNIARSFAMPSSNGRSTAFLTDSIAFSQASKPRNFLALALRIASKISGWPRAGSSLSDRSRTFFNGAFSATRRRAKAIAHFPQLPFFGEFVDHAPFLGLARAERRARTE